MQASYIRHGRRHSIPSTAQILDELKTGFVQGYVPISQSDKQSVVPVKVKANDATDREFVA